MADEPGFSNNQISRRDSRRQNKLLSEVFAALVEVINEIPSGHQKPTGNGLSRARELVTHACIGTAAISAALALRPKASEWSAIAADLATIWRLQARMVTDVGAVFGKRGKLIEESIPRCLFRHGAAQFVRELVIARGERVARRDARPAIEHALENLGTEVIRRMTPRRSRKWLALLGAIAVAAYAYYDTDQMGRAAIGFFSDEIDNR